MPRSPSCGAATSMWCKTNAIWQPHPKSGTRAQDTRPSNAMPIAPSSKALPHPPPNPSLTCGGQSIPTPSATTVSTLPSHLGTLDLALLTFPFWRLSFLWVARLLQVQRHRLASRLVHREYSFHMAASRRRNTADSPAPRRSSSRNASLTRRSSARSATSATVPATTFQS